jgi:hypothetical protein
VLRRDLVEKIEREAVRLGHAEAAVTPLLVRQFLDDRESLLDRSPIHSLDVVHLHNHERTLRASVFEEVRGPVV